MQFGIDLKALEVGRVLEGIEYFAIQLIFQIDVALDTIGKLRRLRLPLPPVASQGLFCSRKKVMRGRTTYEEQGWSSA